MRKNAWTIQQFSDDLKNHADHPRSAPGSFATDPEKEEKVVAIMRDMVLASNALAQIAKELEFFINGDISRDVFLERYAAIEREQAIKLAGITG